MIVVIGIMTTVSKLISISASVVGYNETADVDGPKYYVGTESMEKVVSWIYDTPMNVESSKTGMTLKSFGSTPFVTLLQRPTAECNILLTEPPLNPTSNREKLVTIAFKNSNAQGVYIANSAVLALYASGCSTVLVLNSGDGVTRAVPMYEGLSQDETVGILRIGGADVTNYMLKMLAEEEVPTATYSWFEIARLIKEDLRYVSSNIKSEQGADRGQYKLPDGEVISAGVPRYQVPEALFNPDLLDPDLGQGIHNLTFNSITKFLTLTLGLSSTKMSSW